ncbi:uncharacterized protein LOC125654726 [Ostrea edulis]|uniref:uncharacterized protein LOC125654726 n=1 Tax=Ostrea edulis TaxID=37623 RepID=UPI0024AFA604|nr:uncharacterized protein LOC125654726 [Ostrea edulis]
MKKSNFIIAAALSFGLACMYMTYSKSSMNNELKETHKTEKSEPTKSIPNSNKKPTPKPNSFNPSDAEKYQKYIRKYTLAYDKNCILTLQDKYKGHGDLPLKIPVDNEINSLSEEVIACLYHRYVTTIQTFCAFKDRAGEARRNGWYVCADPAYAPKENGVVFLSNTAFPESTFSADMVSRYKSSIHATPLSSANTLQSWIHKTKTPNSVIDILTMSVSATSGLGLIHTMVQEKSILKVKQLFLELHFDPKDTKKQDYIQLLNSLRLLHDSGLRIVWFDRLFHCATTKFNKCYAVYFVQPNLRDKTATSLSLDLPSEEEIRKMKTTDITDLYFKYIETTQFFCQQVLRLGWITDGGWDVCHDKMLQYRNPCIVYSFGVLNDFSFDDEIAATYDCSVYSFDPTTPFGTHQHSPRVWFYQLGIGSEYKKFGAGFIAPLKKIRADLHHQSSPITIVKADVEGAEWGSIPDMINTNELASVSQLYVEFHGKGDTPDQLLVLKKIHDAGFRIFWYHLNPACAHNKQIPRRAECQEVYFINTKL